MIFSRADSALIYSSIQVFNYDRKVFENEWFGVGLTSPALSDGDEGVIGTNLILELY